MKRPVVLLTSLLVLFPAVLISYRVLALRYPPFPTAPGEVWRLTMEARIVGPHDGEVLLRTALPETRPGLRVSEEMFTSGMLDLNLLREGSNRLGVWSGPIHGAMESIAYRAIIVVRGGYSPEALMSPMLEAYPAGMGSRERALAERLVAKWSQLPPPERLRAVAAMAKGQWGRPPPTPQDIRAWSTFREKRGAAEAFMVLTRAAGLPARRVEGLLLAEGVVTRPLAWIDVFTGTKWESLSPATGTIYRKPIPLLPLASGSLSAVRVSEGKMRDIRWTMIPTRLSGWRLHFERIMRSDRFLDRWSLFSLPPEFQETFRILLLVPVGALMIAVLRNIVGFPTFGIFMPVLMALAFRNTGLLYGLGIFTGVVLIGAVVRRAMDNLRLLLVPRLSALLTLVIACLTVLALVGSKLALWQFMGVGLLPIVILTMAIERFFILLEEAGPWEALLTTTGTAMVATIAYGIIRWESLQLTFFIYPELISAVAAMQLLLGRYTGFRLSELIRFRAFRSAS
ncbi:MAG: UUP1 family membrane protein [Candidatus Methylomirabilales bacterium]